MDEITYGCFNHLISQTKCERSQGLQPKIGVTKIGHVGHCQDKVTDYYQGPSNLQEKLFLTN